MKNIVGKILIFLLLAYIGGLVFSEGFIKEVLGLNPRGCKP